MSPVLEPYCRVCGLPIILRLDFSYAHLVPAEADHRPLPTWIRC